jgi:DNA-binding FadR family transcriptional regulator
MTAEDSPFSLYSGRSGGFTTPKKALLIADALAQEIFEKGLEPGTPLATEAEMLNDFKVGRATLREALRLLEAEGLIVVRAGSHGGAVVGRPSLDRLSRLLSILFAVSGTTVAELVAVRRIFEPELCSLAAEHATDEEIAYLELLMSQAKAALHDVRRSVELSAEFHTAVAIAGKNRVLTTFWLASSHIINQQMGVGYHRADVEGAYRAHEKIMAAIRKRSPQQARAAMTTHVEAVFSHLEQSQGRELTDPVRFLSGNVTLR